MSCIRSRTACGALTLALSGVFLTGVPFSPPEAPADETITSETASRESALLDRPDLRHERGSGWKPYNRVKWATERRMRNGRLPAPGARWEAWLVKRERDGSVTPRSGWFEIGPVNLSGRILDIDFHPTDPDIVYAGSASGGLWKSTDGGDTWTTSTAELPTLGVGAVEVLPWNSDIVLIGTGEATMNIGRVGGVGVLRSTDGGNTWGPTDLSYPVAGLYGHGFHVMESNPATGTILAGATDGLWRSTDEGMTWTAVRTGGDYYDVKWKPGDASRVYTVKGEDDGGNNVKVSTDDGLTWAKAGTGQPLGYQIGKTKIAVSPAEPDWIWANYTNSQTWRTLGVYRSTDNGATWEALNTDTNMVGYQGWYNVTLAVDPDDTDRLLAGGVPMWVSNDGGWTWLRQDKCPLLGNDDCPHVDHHAIIYEPGSTSNVWVATDGGVWRSTDDGRHWMSRRDGMATYQFYDICVAQSDPIFVMGGTQDNGVPGRDGENTWFVSNLIADGMVCNINPTRAHVIYAEAQFGWHVKSRNGGQSWFDIMDGISGYGTWVTPVDEDQNVPNHLYTTSGGSIYRTTDGGSPWVNVASHTATWISISPVDGNVVWTVHDSTGVLVTVDDGESWSAASPYGFATGPVTKILAHPTDVDAAFVTFGAYDTSVAHIAITIDQGATWQDVTGDFPTQPVNAIVVDPLDTDYWYIGTDVGVWVSTNGGVNWFPFEAGLPNAVVYDLEIQRSARKLVAGTHGRGAWEVALPPPNSNRVGEVAAAPSLNLMLDPPFPNPVADRTWLRYAARHAGRVTLDVYDVRGRLVSHLAVHSGGDGVIRAVPWVTEDVPSGIYFAVLTAGKEDQARKIVVTR
jgi:photosystem II stability/assembly factor-like uncharacterized protein